MANNGDLVSNTLPMLRFKLINPDTEQFIILRHEPIEWADGQLELNRIIEVGGVFTSFLVDSLTFIKEGASFVRNIFNEKEINGRCNLEIAWFKLSTRTYINFPTTFSLNFATIKPNVKIGKNTIGLSVEAINSSEQTKFDNRRKTKVDLTKTIINNSGDVVGISVGGVEIIPYQNLSKDINMPAFNINVYANWVDNVVTEKQIENNESNIIYTNFQMALGSTDYVETKDVSYATNITNINSIANFYEGATGDVTLDFTYEVEVKVTNRKGGFLDAKDVYRFRVEEIEPGGTIVQTFDIASFGRTLGNKTFSGTQSISITSGNNLRTYIATDATGGVSARIVNSDFNINYAVSGTEIRNVEGLPIYEALESSLQRILDTQYPFYSIFFARFGVPYNADGDYYLTENQLRFASLATGLNFRGAALFDNDNPLAISFDTLFQCVNSIWNVGYEFEFRDTYRIRIENYSYFFSDVEVLDISDRISVYDIETEVMPELAFESLKSGFKNFDYEEVNGRGEYNTNNERTSLINTDTVFDNVSDVRADTKGILKNLGQELTTTDSKEDNDIFILKTQKNILQWKPEFDENIAVENNSSLFGDQSLNLLFTPTRNLIRHGSKIKGYLTKYLSSKLRFQTSDKKQTVKTTGEGYTVTENDDILVDDLEAPIYKPIKHTVEVRFDYDDLETLMANPKGYINFGNVTGYLLNLKKKNNEDKAILTIIERYVNE